MLTFFHVDKCYSVVQFVSWNPANEILYLCSCCLTLFCFARQKTHRIVNVNKFPECANNSRILIAFHSKLNVHKRTSEKCIQKANCECGISPLPDRRRSVDATSSPFNATVHKMCRSFAAGTNAHINGIRMFFQLMMRILCVFMLSFSCRIMRSYVRIRENSYASFCEWLLLCAASVLLLYHFMCCYSRYSNDTCRAHASTHGAYDSFGRKSAIASDGFSYDADVERMAVKPHIVRVLIELYFSHSVSLCLLCSN